MSHFTVLVVGNNVDEQLAPYHEFECTGHDDKYVQDMDITEECRKEYNEREKDTEQTFVEFIKDWHGINLVPFGKTPDLSDEHKYGYVQLDKNNKVVKVIRRTNPNSKWDWYVIGGRWGGYFKLKKGAEGTLGERGVPQMIDNQCKLEYNEMVEKMENADQVLKKDVDFEFMREEASKEASERYDKVMKAWEGLPVHKSWDDIRESVKDIEKARQVYHNQSRIKALSENKDRELIWIDADDYLVSKEKYVEDARNGAISTFALVKDGKWYERGKMGWWACVSNEKAAGEWEKEFSKMLDEVSDDTLLTVVDCHI